jgi:hypothetical protein
MIQVLGRNVKFKLRVFKFECIDCNWAARGCRCVGRGGCQNGRGSRLTAMVTAPVKRFSVQISLTLFPDGSRPSWIMSSLDAEEEELLQLSPLLVLVLIVARLPPHSHCASARLLQS